MNRQQKKPKVPVSRVNDVGSYVCRAFRMLETSCLRKTAWDQAFDETGLPVASSLRQTLSRKGKSACASFHMTGAAMRS